MKADDTIEALVAKKLRFCSLRERKEAITIQFEGKNYKQNTRENQTKERENVFLT